MPSAGWASRAANSRSRSRRSISTDSFCFVQAEAGIRDLTMTGVQTCALPILAAYLVHAKPGLSKHRTRCGKQPGRVLLVRFMRQHGENHLVSEDRHAPPPIARIYRQDKIGRASCRERG